MSKLTYVKYDITDFIYGESWDLFLTYKGSDGLPIPLTGKRLYGEFREGKNRKARLVKAIDSNNATITITDAANGEFRIDLSAEDMLLFPKGKGIWDVWIIDGADRDLLVQGTWTSDEAATDWETFEP